MKTYVLGAGASLHAGYPSASTMGVQLLTWMQKHPNPNYRASAQWVFDTFGLVVNVEELFSTLDSTLGDSRRGTEERGNIASFQKPTLTRALQEWFIAIRNSEAGAYRSFSDEIVERGDCIITFNYDVSLDRELHIAGKWELGDGYGFDFDGFPCGSQTKLLKLHGSANWIALLFGGITSGITAVLDGSLGVRPVIAANELSFLGYCGLTDPRFRRPGGSILPWILPTRNKRFFFETSFGREWEDFWDSLWEQARQGLRASEAVFVLGYSLAAADERACELLFSSLSPDAKIEIASGSATDSIVGRFKNAGYQNAVGARITYFEKWVEGMCSRS